MSPVIMIQCDGMLHSINIVNDFEVIKFLVINLYTIMFLITNQTLTLSGSELGVTI